MTDPLAPFDTDLLESVAASDGLTTERLRELVIAHHEHAARMPGIDELVFEWRRFLPYDPLVARTADAYHLAVDSSVWTEFGEQLALDGAELSALRTLHERQAERSAAARGALETPFERRDAMLLSR